jgi:PPM family protein phosphatase
VSARAAVSFASAGQRPVQEDHAVAEPGRGIFAVADGFGGPAAGAAASRAACEAVKSFLVKEAGDAEATLPFVLRPYFSLAGNVLFNAVLHANRRVRALNRDKGVHERGGASLVAALVDGEMLTVANAGCCTAWLLRGGSARELVLPRSYGRVVDPFAGGGAAADAPLVSLGVHEELEAEIFEYRMRPGDWLVLASDGLTEEAREGILAVKRRELSLAQAQEQVLTWLGGCRFNDNATVSLIIF